MSNKKVWIIIVLAAILAFLTAAMIVDKRLTKIQTYDKPATQEEVAKEEAAVKPIETVEKKIEPAPAINVVKKSAPPRKIPTPKVKPVPVILKPELQPEATVENEEKTETSNEVVILQEYKSQNSYKYIYTPVRYKSK